MSFSDHRVFISKRDKDMTTKEKRTIRELFTQYLSKNNCSELSIIENTNSRIDFTMRSGRTSVICEVKERPIPSYQYKTTVLELQKYKSLQLASALFQGPTLYIIFYTDVVLIFQLDFQKEIELDTIPMPKSGEDSTIEYKDVIHLNNVDADYILNRQTFNKGTKDLFIKYMTFHQNQSKY